MLLLSVALPLMKLSFGEMRLVVGCKHIIDGKIVTTGVGVIVGVGVLVGVGVFVQTGVIPHMVNSCTTWLKVSGT